MTPTNRLPPRLVVLTLIGLALCAGPAAAGSASDPEISDAPADVNPDLLLPADLVALEDPQKVAQAADLRAVYIAGETDQNFNIAVKYGAIPSEPDAPGVATQTWIYFTIKGIDHRASITLFAPKASPNPDAPEASLSWHPWYNVTRGSSNQGVPGDVNPETATAFITIPKSAVGNPAPGDKISRFWAVTRLGSAGPALDYAPGATALNPAAFDPANPAIAATPQYGRDYTFGAHIGAAPAIQVTAPASTAVTEGRTGLVAVTIKNDAAETDTVRIAVASAPAGWMTDVQPATLTLAPGQSRAVSITLAPGANAADVGLLTLQLTSDLGADQQPAVTLQLDRAPATSTPPPTTTPPPTQPPADTQGDAAGDDEKGSPGPAGLLVLAGLAGAAAWKRRRA